MQVYSDYSSIRQTTFVCFHSQLPSLVYVCRVRTSSTAYHRQRYRLFADPSPILSFVRVQRTCCEWASSKLGVPPLHHQTEREDLSAWLLWWLLCSLFNSFGVLTFCWKVLLIFVGIDGGLSPRLNMFVVVGAILVLWVRWFVLVIVEMHLLLVRVLTLMSFAVWVMMMNLQFLLMLVFLRPFSLLVGGGGWLLGTSSQISFRWKKDEIAGVDSLHSQSPEPTPALLTSVSMQQWSIVVTQHFGRSIGCSWGGSCFPGSGEWPDICVERQCLYLLMTSRLWLLARENMKIYRLRRKSREELRDWIGFALRFDVEEQLISYRIICYQAHWSATDSQRVELLLSCWCSLHFTSWIERNYLIEYTYS